MSADIVIRAATAEDENLVIGLWRVCGLTASYNDPAQDYRLALGKGNSEILLGVDASNHIVGSIMVGHDGHRGWIYYVAVDPAQQGLGTGRRMVSAAEHWLEERNIVKVMLLVRETNTKVVEFYNRIGFEAIPRVVMQKWLIEPSQS